MKTWTLPILATLAAATAVVSLDAMDGLGARVHAHQEAHAHGAEAHLEALARELELDAAQRARVAAALKAALPSIEERAVAVAAALGEQIALVHADAVDEDALRAASARSGAAQGDLAIAIARLLGDVHRVLRPDQLERVRHGHAGDPSAALARHVRELLQGARAWAERG